MDLYSLYDGCGFLAFAENRTGMMSFSIQLDASESFNLTPSRGAGCTATLDVLPPNTAQLLQVLTICANAEGWRLQIRSKSSMAPFVGGEMHSPELLAPLHMPLPPASAGAGAGDASSGGGLGRMLAGLFG